MKTQLIVALALSIAPAFGVIIISEDFANSSGSVVTLNGTAPDVNTVNSNTWVANARFSLTTNGTLQDTDTGATTNGGASIDLGASHFVNNPGVYTLTGEVSFITTTVDVVWGIGFSNGATVNNSDSLAASGATPSGLGRPWVFVRENNTGVVRAPSMTDQTLTPGTVNNSLKTIKLVLDASSSVTWTYTGYLNGVQIGTTQSIPANSDLRWIGIAATDGGSALTNTGTFDNFTVDFVAVPEPGSLVLVGIGALGFLRRRR